MDIEKEIRKILVDEEMSVTDLAESIGTSRQNLNNKLKRKDMKVSDFINILDILGYEIKFKKK